MTDPSSPSSACSDAKAVDPAIARLIESVLIASPVARALGIGLQCLKVDSVVLTLPFKRENVTVGHIVHGGVIATLIDVAGAAAAASGADPASLKGGATSSLAISFLAPADGVDLTAEAQVVRRGARQVVSDVTVFVDAVPVAKALVTSALF